jgi:hypothetical protein
MVYEKFLQYHHDNPRVYFYLQKFAHQAYDSGCQRYAIQTLIERLRWHVDVETRDEYEDFKINNCYSAYYARLLMNKSPTLLGFFRTCFIAGIDDNPEHDLYHPSRDPYLNQPEVP